MELGHGGFYPLNSMWSSILLSIGKTRTMELEDHSYGFLLGDPERFMQEPSVIRYWLLRTSKSQSSNRLSPFDVHPAQLIVRY